MGQQYRWAYFDQLAGFHLAIFQIDWTRGNGVGVCAGADSVPLFFPLLISQNRFIFLFSPDEVQEEGGGKDGMSRRIHRPRRK